LVICRFRGSDVVSDDFYLGDKAVALLRKGLDITWRVGVVVECLTQLLNGGVEAVLEINEGVLRPEAFAEVVAGDDFAGAFQQDGQNFDRLAVEVELVAELEEFAGLGIELKGPKADPLTCCGGQRHLRTPLA